MKLLNGLLDTVRNLVRSFMRRVAGLINRLSGGRVSANVVTYTGLLAHVPIAWLISQGYFGYAAGLLVVFGLFDTLDGELARLQGKQSNAGMLLDATTDRMKEVLLYAGAAYVFVLSGEPYFAVWAVLAVGGSLLVSYVKAKGETAVADTNLSANEKNRLFQDGIIRFEVRMTLLIIGLVFNILAIIVAAIAVLAWLTAFERLIKISRRL